MLQIALKRDWRLPAIVYIFSILSKEKPLYCSIREDVKQIEYASFAFGCRDAGIEKMRPETGETMTKGHDLSATSSSCESGVDQRDGGIERRPADIRDFWKTGFSFGTFTGVGDVPLSYAARRVQAGRGDLVVVSGRTEFMEKYAELLYDLKDLDLSLYIYDHRGQGSSARLLPDTEKGHVESFGDYVRDLAIFIEEVVKPREQRRVILLSHSMGGAISLLYASRHHELVKGMILSSPMLSINTQPFPPFLARIISQAASLIGRGTDYVFGAGPYDRSMPFTGNILTSSKERFELPRGLVAQNPQLALGGPTFNWLAEALAATAALNEGRVNVQLPVLLLRGEADQVVGAKEQDEICRRLEDCRFVSFPQALHEVLMENDEIRAQALREIREFIGRLIEG
jgi:lysophospholipase